MVSRIICLIFLVVCFKLSAQENEWYRYYISCNDRVDMLECSADNLMIFGVCSPPKCKRLTSFICYGIGGFEVYDGEVDFFDLVRIEEEDLVFAATSRGIWKSDNGGLGWEKTDDGMVDRPARRIISNSEGVLFVVWANGEVSRSFDEGVSWDFSINQFFYPEMAVSIAVNSLDQLYVGTSYPFSGLYFSDNNGSSWEKSDCTYFESGEVSSININSDDDIFVCKKYDYAGVFRSTDNGET